MNLYPVIQSMTETPVPKCICTQPLIPSSPFSSFAVCFRAVAISSPASLRPSPRSPFSSSASAPSPFPLRPLFALLLVRRLLPRRRHFLSGLSSPFPSFAVCFGAVAISSPPSKHPSSKNVVGRTPSLSERSEADGRD
ncbi:hypothetical protein MUK42_37116 [Musa troglodytarum]|uniref:Uncharacterized protein n=1 Tax=Musa troglodytarum TaxID=320322 RepID=A0A9E7K1G4_9LILI|nr:hypothetical protein MUK42_37116 [Musa troglodytarum]